MELVCLERVSVKIFNHTPRNVEVVVPLSTDGSVTAGTIHNALCKHLGLHASSWSYFVLSQGRDYPEQVLEPSHVFFPPIKDLCLFKWVFDSKSEKILLTDPMAASLVYGHAKYFHNSGDLRDSEFVVWSQRQPHYFTSVIPDCRLSSSVTHSQLEEGAPVSVMLSSNGIYFTTDEVQYFVSWSKVKSWRYSHESESFSVEVVRREDQACSVTVSTRRLQYLLSVLSQHIKQAQSESQKEVLFFANMQQRSDNWVILQNALYDPKTEVCQQEGAVNL